MNRFVFLTMRVKIFLIISAGLCFSLVADAKAVKIPQWIFGFTFDAPVTVRRAQCKALKGMWNYGSDMCINPQLTGLGSECSKLDVFVGFVSGNTLPGMRQDRLWFLYPEDQSRKELLACHNKWLEWAHSSFGEPEKKDLYNCWWSKDSETDSPWADAVPKTDAVHIRSPYSDKGMWIWFSKSTPINFAVDSDVKKVTPDEAIKMCIDGCRFAAQRCTSLATDSVERAVCAQKKTECSGLCR